MAVHHLTRHLAKRLAPEITVNAIAPGPFRSKMMAATLDAFGESRSRSQCAISSASVGRTIWPERPSTSPPAAGVYLTGAIIPVDGGISTTR